MRNNILLTFLLVFSGLLLFPGHAYPEEKPFGKVLNKRDILKLKGYDKSLPASERSCGMYLDISESIYKGEKSKSHFLSLRNSYARCPFYDPYGEDTLRSMAEFREKVQGGDPVEGTKALRAYKSLLKNHIANLAVVEMAYKIAKEDTRFGSADFFREVKKLIVESLRDPFKDGTEPSRAIQIITMAEQDYVIRHAGGKLVKEELLEDSDKFYYVLDFVKEKARQEFTIYLDVSMPMIVMRTQQREAEKAQKMEALGAQ